MQQITGLIKRNFKNIDFQCFLLLYKSMIRSHLQYAQTVWSPFKAKLIEEVETVQNVLLPGLRQLSYTQLLQKLRLPTLVYTRARSDMIEVLKIVHGCYYPECVPYLQPSSYCNYTRGHNRMLFKLQSHLDLCKNVFTVRVFPK